MAEKPGKKSMVDPELIRELSRLLDETGLSEIEIEQEGQRIRVARGGRAAPATVIAAPAAAVAPKPITESAAASVDPAKHPGVVISPMVGTAYAAGSPGAKPYVEIGAKVKVVDLRKRQIREKPRQIFSQLVAHRLRNGDQQVGIAHRLADITPVISGCAAWNELRMRQRN